MSHCYGYTTSNIPLVKMRSLEIKNHEIEILFGGFISYKNYTTQCSNFFQKVLNIKKILSIWNEVHITLCEIIQWLNLKLQINEIDSIATII